MTYQTFSTLDELLDYVKRNAKHIDGKYAVGEAVEYFEQIERQSEESKRLKTERDAEAKRAKDAETKLKASESKLAENETEIENLKSTKPENEKIREISEKLKETNRLRSEAEAKNRDLADQLSEHEKIVKQYDELKTRERSRTIVEAVRKEGKDLKFPESVLSNEKLIERYLAHELNLDETTGKVYGKDNIPLKKHLEALQKTDPELFAPRSQGAGANPNQPGSVNLSANALSLADSLLAAKNS